MRAGGGRRARQPKGERVQRRVAQGLDKGKGGAGARTKGAQAEGEKQGGRERGGEKGGGGGATRKEDRGWAEGGEGLLPVATLNS